jgi:hypothetical protein
MGLESRLKRLERESGYDLNGGKGGELLDLSHLSERELELLVAATEREKDLPGDHFPLLPLTAEEQAALDRAQERNEWGAS